jgi:hypothetical protein
MSTAPVQKVDCIESIRHVMLKFFPDTTYYITERHPRSERSIIRDGVAIIYVLYL